MPRFCCNVPIGRVGIGRGGCLRVQGYRFQESSVWSRGLARKVVVWQRGLWCVRSSSSAAAAAAGQGRRQGWSVVTSCSGTSFECWPLGGNMKSKQMDIAVFFGGKPKGGAMRQLVDKASAASGKSEKEEKLRDDKGMEDDYIEEEEANVVGKKRAIISSSSEYSLGGEGDGDESEESGSVGSDEAEDVEIKPEKKRKKSLSPKKKNGKKTEGVGALAVKAAEQHQQVDISSLITWGQNEPIPFAFLSNTFEGIAEESKRLVITSLLTNSFRAIIESTPDDLLATVYLCTNQISPAHEGIELGIGDSILIKAISQATGRKESAIKADYDENGDLGMVAANARGGQKTMFKPKPLTVRGVLKAFRDIAAAEGTKSQERKRNMIVKLLAAASQNEAGYLIRALQGKLRIGLAEQTVLVSIAHAILLQKGRILEQDVDIASELEEGAKIVKSVYSECPSYEDLIPALLSTDAIHDLPSKVHFRPGIPVKPMLAKPTTGVSEVLDKFANQPFTCEYKYDGERAQIHLLEDGTVKVGVVCGVIVFVRHWTPCYYFKVESNLLIWYCDCRFTAETVKTIQANILILLPCSLKCLLMEPRALSWMPRR